MDIHKNHIPLPSSPLSHPISHPLSHPLSHPFVIRVAGWVKTLLMDIALENDDCMTNFDYHDDDHDDDHHVNEEKKLSQMFMRFLESTLTTSLHLPSTTSPDISSISTSLDLFTLS
eukprot:CAMPEP_0118667466 /NCGR_PEP_ID=MMETSP0785-20121206/19806_1 /TAXON_ID=91992 /ORGANISM="Bolidomonas pacifica, Strain CCMP 1866" /LENGTH=115 /DNA_ID=CAMNT_0006561931 /DNA_START=106 /DNA_END=449 /DNA_ORIENTATION=-